VGRHILVASFLALNFGFATAAHAELRHLEIKTLGMD